MKQKHSVCSSFTFLSIYGSPSTLCFFIVPFFPGPFRLAKLPLRHRKKARLSCQFLLQHESSIIGKNNVLQCFCYIEPCFGLWFKDGINNSISEAVRKTEISIHPTFHSEKEHPTFHYLQATQKIQGFSLLAKYFFLEYVPIEIASKEEAEI